MTAFAIRGHENYTDGGLGTKRIVKVIKLPKIKSSEFIATRLENLVTRLHSLGFGVAAVVDRSNKAMFSDYLHGPAIMLFDGGEGGMKKVCESSNSIRTWANSEYLSTEAARLILSLAVLNRESRFIPWKLGS